MLAESRQFPLAGTTTGREDVELAIAGDVAAFERLYRVSRTAAEGPKHDDAFHVE